MSRVTAALHFLGDEVEENGIDWETSYPAMYNNDIICDPSGVYVY